MKIEKVCDRCGASDVRTEANGETIRDGEGVVCIQCGLNGIVVFHGATCGDRVEDRFDLVWIDPETGEAWKV